MRVTEITVPGEKGDVKWNAYTPDGAWGSRTTKALEKRGFRSSQTHPSDGMILTSTMNAIERPKPLGTVKTDCITVSADKVSKLENSLAYPANGTTITATVRPDDFIIDASHIRIGETRISDLKPFKCPCCGGNSYRTVNGKTVCEYCDTEFVR